MSMNQRSALVKTICTQVDDYREFHTTIVLKNKCI